MNSDIITPNRYGYHMAKTIGEMMKNFGSGRERNKGPGKSSYMGLAVGLSRHGTRHRVPVDAVKVPHCRLSRYSAA